MQHSDNSQTLTYQKAGVDIDSANQFIELIKPIVKRTLRPEVLTSIGGFGGLFEIPLERYRKPVLVSGTDGVGTKLKLACELDRHDTIGIDLVAMCVNDVIVCGAEPLFFLDYFATGKLSVATAKRIIEGIADGCQQANAALIGGETAEMPGLYQGDDYDLAGFCVGIVERDRIITGDDVKKGDALIGIASSGPHANGFSLIRKIIEVTNVDMNATLADRTFADTLLEPTRIYVKSLLALIEQYTVKAVAHITGGGLLENIPRVLPSQYKAMIDRTSWQMPEIFQWLQKEGHIEEQEMWRTFNCGIGLVVCVAAEDVGSVIETLTTMGESAWQLGIIDDRQADEAAVIIED